MKTIAFSIQKGGVGKTSLSVSLAAELAKETGSVLLIDADPQGSATNWIGQAELTAELSDVLFRKIELKDAIAETAAAGLHLLPSAGLGGELNLYAKTMSDRQEGGVKEIAREAAAMGYRCCVIDMSPTFGLLERSCFLSADEVITPILPDSFAADGLATFADNLRRFRREKETARPFYKRIIVNGVDRRIPQYEDNVAKIKKANAGFSIYEFSVDPAFRKSQAAGLAIQDFGAVKKNNLAELSRLAKDIMKEE